MQRIPLRMSGVFFSGIVSIALCILPFAANALTQQAAPDGKAVHVLCYHAFLENEKMYSFTNAETEEHINFFLKKGFRFLSLQNVLAGNYSGTKNILVTIDDGNRSVFQAYYSVFKKYGIVPLLGIYPSIIGKKEYAMTWDEVRKLAREGCPIASHGYTHQYVNKKLYDSNRDMFNKEIFRSKSVLEKELGRIVSIFVYPFGVHSPITVEKVREAGYRYAFSIQGGHLAPDDVIKDGLELPRYLMTRKNAEGLLAYISRDAEKLQKEKKSVVAEKPAGSGTEKSQIVEKPAKTSNEKKVMADKPAKPRIEKKSVVAEKPAQPRDEKSVIADKPEKPRKEKKTGPLADRALLPVLYPVMQAGEQSSGRHAPELIKEGEPGPVAGDVLCEVKSADPGNFLPDIAGERLKAAGISTNSLKSMEERIRDSYHALMNSSAAVYLRMVELVRSRVFTLKKSFQSELKNLTAAK